jgi:alpha-tubulin suppressor-like RCC1 family protein
LVLLALGCGARTGLDTSSYDASVSDTGIDAGSIPDAAVGDAPSLCPASVDVTNDPIVLPPVQLALGTAHTCVIAGDGVWCWGTDLQRELGTKTTSQARPVRVKAQPVTQIASGSAFDICSGTRGSHTCARMSDGRVVCWGSNVEGETDSKLAKPTPNPIEMFNLSSVTQVAVSGYHSCVLFADGSAGCWGSDAHGQLGDGQIVDATKPPVSVSIASIAQIATGHESSCAVLKNGKVSCWGDGSFGVLGDGTTTTRGTPSDVVGINTATSIALFWFHACALLKDQSVVCWGWNDSGQIGDGTKQDRSTPVKVSALSNVIQISVGVKHSCAVTSTGDIFCWGSNSFGQLGAGAFGQQELAPTKVEGIDLAIEVRTGLFHTCARRRDSSIWCWGWNDFGQLGDGTTTARSRPVRVYP